MTTLHATLRVLLDVALITACVFIVLEVGGCLRTLEVVGL